ncbi:hypothetical protein HCH52_10940 [Oscillospiraceae bacterium HV4-5-C5C]|nr:hypothetical protein [Oscillospiraceae bacterium HV4-5-C5C]
MEEALVKLYLSDISVRQVKDITAALWAKKICTGTVSKLNKKDYGKIEHWRQRQLVMHYPYGYLNGIYLKRNWAGMYKNDAILVTMAVTRDRQRKRIGAMEGKTIVRAG